MNGADKPQRTGRLMVFSMWLLLIGGMAFFFNQWLAHRDNPNQHVAAGVNSQGNPEVVLNRNRAGHFVSSGHINGQAVTFLVDTGATDVNIPGHVAKRLNLRRGQPHSASTANGIITVYGTELTTIGIDRLALRNIRASINPHMHSEEILLGMSFLKHLEFRQRGSTLTLSIAD